MPQISQNDIFSGKFHTICMIFMHATFVILTIYNVELHKSTLKVKTSNCGCCECVLKPFFYIKLWPSLQKNGLICKGLICAFFKVIIGLKLGKILKCKQWHLNSLELDWKKKTLINMIVSFFFLKEPLIFWIIQYIIYLVKSK
jgi:hypothetical protein